MLGIAKNMLMIKKVIINLALLLITIILFLALFEIFLRIFYPQPLNSIFIPTRERDTFAEYDSLLGWKLKPDFDGIFFSNEYYTYIKNNAQGLRMNNNLSLEKSKYRIAFLGDSFIWGHGVNDGERISNVLEKELKNSEILNFGVSGYATDQYYLQIKNTILNYKPDLVIIRFYANDLEDAGNNIMQGYPKPLFKIKENDLELTNVPVPKIQSLIEREYSLLKKIDLYLSYKSHIYVLFKPVLSKIYSLTITKKSRQYKLTTYEIPIAKKIYLDDYKNYKNLNDELYCKISKLLKEEGIPLVVVNIPAKIHVFPKDFNKALKELELNADDYDLNKISDMFIKLSEECNFEFVDLYPSFLDYKDKEKLYYKYDLHLTPLGNEYASKIILQKLKEKSL